MEYKIYKSKYKGKQVDDAINKIPQDAPTEDSVIVVKSSGVPTYKAVSDIGGGDIKNFEDGSGASAVQQKQDGVSGVVDYTGKNANTTKLDSAITGGDTLWSNRRL